MLAVQATIACPRGPRAHRRAA